MSDDNWLARQYERTGAEVAKWPTHMREMLDEERGKRTVSEQVRECPCCPTGRGGRRHGYDGGHLAYWVECSICGLSTRHYETPAAAIAAWNQRAAPKPAPEALHGYWQVEPIEEQPPTITTTYCQGCQEKETELAALRQEKDEAIGAALQVEQKCYDQAQEIKTLRETIAARERNLEFRANLITEQRNELIKAEAELAPLRALRERILWFVRMMYGIGVINGTQAGELVGLSLPDILAKVESGEWPAQGEVAAAETRALRELREACEALADDDGVSWLWHEQGPKMAGKAQEGTQCNQ